MTIVSDLESNPSLRRLGGLGAIGSESSGSIRFFVLVTRDGGFLTRNVKSNQKYDGVKQSRGQV